LATFSQTFQNWGKAVGLEGYLERERYLSTVPLNANGGLTHWILVDESLPADERPILASCESLRKRVVVRVNGVIKEGITHGIGSVFCYPEHRGKGYPKKMLSMLGKQLKTWQTDKNTPCFFSILYSDIGKNFYAKHGWHPYPAKHLGMFLLKLSGALFQTSSGLPELFEIHFKSKWHSQARYLGSFKSRRLLNIPYSFVLTSR